jgi:hypothetical protein
MNGGWLKQSKGLIEFTFGNGSAVVIQIRTLRNDANCFTLRADNWLGQKLKTYDV